MFTANRVAYKDTNAFSQLVLDYVAATPGLSQFYTYKPTLAGIEQAVADRKNYAIDRSLLGNTLTNQYKNMPQSAKLTQNIASLYNHNTYTVCTAHQPNIFTGHLYFIYKILHAIQLCDLLKAAMPTNYFVPVYYMGSEDADLAELGEVYIKGETYQWQTNQTGAVGRMLIDKNFIQIIESIAGQLAVEEHGTSIMDVVKKMYTEGTTIQSATFQFVHYLFNDYGLVVLLPDDRQLKASFAPIIKKELEEQFSAKAVASTVAELQAEYTVQASGRPINLFYLANNTRERIEAVKNEYAVVNTTIKYTAENIKLALLHQPELFSPNVILRPVYQELLLPNVAFIGGGGEISYWLTLKKVFEEAAVFFPPLILRNSYSIIDKNVASLLAGLGLQPHEIFKAEKQLIDELVKKATTNVLQVDDEKEALKVVYEKIKQVANKVDTTLSCHVHALRTQALHRLDILEKKMLKAEKKKFDAQQRQIKKIKTALYPNHTLQERKDNVLSYISKYGDSFIPVLYSQMHALQPEFTILTEQ